MGRLLALLYDRMMASSEDAGLRERRDALLAQARGDVLELGAGTGASLSLYPRAGIRRIVALEPDRHMARRLRRRTGDAPAPVEVVEAPAESLPFPDASFDTAVAMLMLCSVQEPRRVVAEVARVLRPGGALLFLEHVRSDDARAAHLQDRVEPLWRRVCAGCHPNRATLATVAESLEVREVEHGRFPKSPPIVRPLIQGVATRP